MNLESTFIAFEDFVQFLCTSCNEQKSPPSLNHFFIWEVRKYSANPPWLFKLPCLLELRLHTDLMKGLQKYARNWMPFFPLFDLPAKSHGGLSFSLKSLHQIGMKKPVNFLNYFLGVFHHTINLPLNIPAAILCCSKLQWSSRLRITGNWLPSAKAFSAITWTTSLRVKKFF